MRILFSPKKHFKIGSCSKLYIHLKRELSHETTLPEIIPTTKHMLCCLMSISLSSITNIGQNDFITRSLLWSNMVKCSTPSSADCFRTDLCGDRSMKAGTTVTVWDIGRLLRGESFIFLYINRFFPTLKELLCTDLTSQIAAKMVSSPDSSSDLCCLYASKLLPNSPQWTNRSQLSFPSLHNTLLILTKCDPGCWLIAVSSHVHWLTGLSSHVKSCQVIKSTYNEINQ